VNPKIRFCPSCHETLDKRGRHKASQVGSIRRLRREQAHALNPFGMVELKKIQEEVEGADRG